MGDLAGSTINASKRKRAIQSLVSQGFTFDQATKFYDKTSKVSTDAVSQLKIEGVIDNEGKFVDTPENREIYQEAVASEQKETENVLKMYNEQGYSVAADPSTGDMYKIPIGDLGMNEEIEFHSPSSKLPVIKRPFLINMIDSQFKTHAIVVNSNRSTETMITGIKLNPSPDSLTINSSKIINRYHTMTRWVEDHWGDEIDTVTFSGGTFSFFGYRNSTVDKTKVPVNASISQSATNQVGLDSTDSSQAAAVNHTSSDVLGSDINNVAAPDTGLTVQYRQDTGSYQMLKALSNFFNYNGVIYQDDRTYGGTGKARDSFLKDPDNVYFLDHHPRTGMIKERLYVKILFDYMSIIGYFETFDIMEEATSPFKMTYNVVFKAEQTEYQMQG